MRKGYSFDDVLLVPKHGVLSSRADADISSELVSGVTLQVPIISANMPSVTDFLVADIMRREGGIGALHRIDVSIDDAVREFRLASPVDSYGAIVSLGLHDWRRRSEALYNAGARIFLLDVAHGDHDQVVDFIGQFRSMYEREVKLIVGNIATLSAVKYLDLWSIDAIKVGIGPGAACTTREVTGFGIPQLTAIQDIREFLEFASETYSVNVKLIADGGIKNSGDIVKALAAGADTVMVGRLLAGCTESPTGLEYHGNASHQVNGHHAPEGSHGVVEASGTIASVMKKLAWGIRSGVSYGGATNLAELRKNAEFMEVSPLTHIESSVRI